MSTDSGLSAAAHDGVGHEQARVTVPGPIDRDAEFTAVVVESGPALVRTAWLLCGDRVRAEDLAQQALLRTYLAWSRVDDPLSYARRVVATSRINSWRKRRREVLTAPEDVTAAEPGSAADDHAERDLLIRALLTLGTRQRRIVVLRYLVGLPEAEVAADLGVSLGTVKSTASRGPAVRAVRRRASPGADRPGADRPAGPSTSAPDPGGRRVRRRGRHNRSTVHRRPGPLRRRRRLPRRPRTHRGARRRDPLPQRRRGSRDERGADGAPTPIEGTCASPSTALNLWVP